MSPSQLNKSDLIQLAFYLLKLGEFIANKAVLGCCVSYTLKKTDRIICLIKSRIKMTNHNYNIEILKSIAVTKKLGEKMVTKYGWMD